MGKITNKGKAWEWRNSLWMLWTFFTLGFLNYISFFYVAHKVKQRKWFKAGLIYAALFIFMIVTTEIFPEDHWFYDLAFTIYFVGWIVSIIHCIKIRPEYLLRLEAVQATGKNELDELKRKIAMEYGTKKEKELASQEQKKRELKVTEEKKEDKPISVVSINDATVEELGKIPGIGTLFAKKIVDVREQEGGFTSLDHFVAALNIKPHVLERIEPYLSFPEKEVVEEPKKKATGRIIDF